MNCLKNTLRTYASKASDQLRHAAYSVGNADAHSQNYYKKGDKLGSPSGNDSLDSSNRKYTKRASGVATAFGKLTK